MNIGRTSNPILSEKAFRTPGLSQDGSMTVQGTVNKTGILLALVFGGAIFTWNTAFTNPSAMMTFAFISAIAGFIVAMVTIFKKEWSPVTAPIYAALEGAFLGAISAIFEMSYPGIALQAVMLTFGTLFALLMAYTAGWVKVTEKFRMGVFAATGAIFVTYLISMVMGFFGMSIPFLHDSSPIGIGISAVIVIVAALNLVLDFDFIDRASHQGAPKYMEWYGSFGLLVTLVWLYLEILRLLSKLRQR